MTDYTTERLDRDDFVALAKRVLDQRATTRYGQRFYSDDVIEIAENYNGLDLEITRQARPEAAGTPDDHLRVSNPTTMVMNGEIIRHHGEHVYVVPHLKALAGE